MNQYFYVFKLGDNSTLRQFVVPASSFELIVDRLGTTTLVGIGPGSTTYSSVKELLVVRGDTLHDIVRSIKDIGG